MPPLTGYETHGTWTTLAEEATFLAQVAAETTAVHTIGGVSRRDGHPLHRIDIGNPAGSTFLVASMQHGDEPGTREAALIFARDLAYSTDSTVLDYLSTRRVVVLPSVNPDGLPDSRSAGGRDINRDHFEMRRPEGQFIAATLAEVRPHVMVDCHEYEYPTGDENGPDHLSSVSRLPAQGPSIEALAAELHASTRGMLTGNGWSNGVYATTSLASLASAGAAWHAVSMLHESHRSSPLSERVQITLDVLWHIVDRHHADTAAFINASAASRVYARTTRDPYRLRLNPSGYDETTVDVSGYQLTEPLPPEFDVFGIAADDGFVSIQQDARPAIPILLDEQSPYQAVAAERVPWPPPEPGQLYLSDGREVTLRRTDGTSATGL